MKIEIEINSIKLGFDGEKLWLLQPDGEGMEVNAEEIEKLLQDYYKRNF